MITTLQKLGYVVAVTAAVVPAFGQFVPVQQIQPQQRPIQVQNQNQQPILQQQLLPQQLQQQQPNTRSQLPMRQSVGAPRAYTPTTMQTLPRYFNGQYDPSGNSLPQYMTNNALYSSNTNWPYASTYNSYNNPYNSLTISPLASPFNNPYNAYNSPYNSFTNPYSNSGYPVSLPYSGVPFPSAFANPFLNTPVSTFQAPFTMIGNQFPLNSGFGY